MQRELCKIANEIIFALQGSQKENRERGRKYMWINNSWKLPILGKGNRHASPGSAETPNKMNPNRSVHWHIDIKMAKIKNKENLKSCERKADSYLQWKCQKAISRNFMDQRRITWNIQSAERKKNLQPRVPYPEDYHLELKQRLKVFQINEC